MIRSRRPLQRSEISRLLFRAHGLKDISRHLFPGPLFPADTSGDLYIPVPPQTSLRARFVPLAPKLRTPGQALSRLLLLFVRLSEVGGETGTGRAQRLLLGEPQSEQWGEPAELRWDRGQRRTRRTASEGEGWYGGGSPEAGGGAEGAPGPSSGDASLIKTHRGCPRGRARGRAAAPLRSAPRAHCGR